MTVDADFNLLRHSLQAKADAAPAAAPAAATGGDVAAGDSAATAGDLVRVALAAEAEELEDLRRKVCVSAIVEFT